MIKKIIAGAFMTMFIISFASVSYASEAEVVLKMLLKKGVITQADYDEVISDVGEAKEKEDRSGKNIRTST